MFDHLTSTVVLGNEDPAVRFAETNFAVANSVTSAQ